MIDNIIIVDAKPHFSSLSWLLLSRANVLPDEALPLVVFAFQMEMLEEENLCTLRRAAIFFPAEVRTRTGQSLTEGYRREVDMFLRNVTLHGASTE